MQCCKTRDHTHTDGRFATAPVTTLISFDSANGFVGIKRFQRKVKFSWITNRFSENKQNRLNNNGDVVM